MTTIYEISLSPEPQVFNIALGGTPYRMRFLYHNVPAGGWAFDLMDNLGNPILAGIPLVTGVDLLGQFAYLSLGGSIYVQSDGDPSAVPAFSNLGLTSHVYFVTVA